MVWPIVAIIVAVALLVVPVAARTTLPKERPNANWITVGAEVLGHDAKSGGKEGQTWPMLRYGTPGRPGLVETYGGLPIKADDLRVGTETNVLVDPLNPVLPFVASQWAKKMQIIRVVTYASLAVAAVLLIYGIVMLVTQQPA